jgi:uncharacterized protein DUF1707
MDASRRLWPRADLRAGDADRQAVVTELQRHYVDGRLTSEELAERVDHALHARTFGDLASLLTDLPVLDETAIAARTSHGPEDWSHSPSHPRWEFTPSLGVILMVVGLIAILLVFAMPGMRLGFFPWPLLIWGFFFFGRPFGRRRF